jgi:hypothetical protein
VAVLTREEFDAIEFDAAASGDHQAAARRMSKLAVTGVQTASMPRSEAYLRAGEQWLLADDPAAAASGFRLAMADGGPVFIDPRVPLSRALFQLDRPSEAQALIDKLKAESKSDPRTCDLVAELLVERSDLEGALDWATAGVELCLARGSVQGPAETDGDGSARDTPPADGAMAADGAPLAEGGPLADGAPLADNARPQARLRSVSLPAPEAPASDDVAELRMLLSLRYRIRNDLGLAEDSYDKLLDEL